MPWHGAWPRPACQTKRPTRVAPLLVALGVVLAGGLLHGIWTDRWHESGELEVAVALLRLLPEQVGDWPAHPVDLDAQALRQAGAAGHWVRRFTNARTGTSVTIILLCGGTRHMAVHRPEDCYRGAGYEMAGPAASVTLPNEVAPAAFWTARFGKQDAAGAVQLRVFWSWLADGRWQAPDSPRLAFAGFPVLFKLYAVREITGPLGPIEDDPCLDLLRRLVPELTNTLSSS